MNRTYTKYALTLSLVIVSSLLSLRKSKQITSLFQSDIVDERTITTSSVNSTETDVLLLADRKDIAVNQSNVTKTNGDDPIITSAVNALNSDVLLLADRNNEVDNNNSGPLLYLEVPQIKQCGLGHW